MESPVVVDKPPEYHGNPTSERGFPFDEEEGTGAWSELAARHPDIAARLRQRPATWTRKRRPSSQDSVDDSSDFGGFDRFPFDDIPPEFREHFPSHWNRRFGSREEQFPQPQSPQPQPRSPQQNTAATQTDHEPGTSSDEQTHLPQYGLRNTVDLGQKSPADPSVVDAEDRSHRSMSAPPEHRTVNPNSNKMSGQNHQEQPHHPEQPSNVRHIPIFVEGRDEPVINKNVDHGTHFAETKPTYVPPPQPHIDREQYFADDGPGSFPFTKGFDRPFFRPGPQPYTKQKMYPQAAAFTRGASPQRSQSPKPQTYHEPPRPETPSRQQKPAPQQKQPPPQQRQAPPPQQQKYQHPPQQEQHPPQQQKAQSPPPPQAPTSNDPITQILSIQTDVLNLMTDVENFTGSKKDKKYLYLDEMLTRNLIKLDNIETDGKENIRQARKEAIKCIQKCIAVLEAKAEKGTTTPQTQDVEMQNDNTKAAEEPSVQNGDVEMKDTKEEVESQPEQVQKEPPVPEQASEKVNENSEEVKEEDAKAVEKEVEEPQVTDTRPEDSKAQEATAKLEPEPQKKETAEKKQSPKKVVKKRDKSKDKKEVANETKKEEAVTKNEEPKDDKDGKNDMDKDVAKANDENVSKNENKDKQEIVADNKQKIEEVMQVEGNSKGDVKEAQAMEVDSGASQ